MATANPNASPPRRRWPIVLALLAIFAIALLVYMLPTIKAYSQTGSAYAARVVCSCRYVGGRSLEDCKKDLEPGMEIVSLTDLPDENRVEASVPLLASDSATLRPGSGCVLQSWDKAAPSS